MSRARLRAGGGTTFEQNKYRILKGERCKIIAKSRHIESFSIVNSPLSLTRRVVSGGPMSALVAEGPASERGVGLPLSNKQIGGV